MMNRWVIAVVMFLVAVPASLAADDMEAFPPAEEGMVRYVLQLPQQADESAPHPLQQPSTRRDLRACGRECSLSDLVCRSGGQSN